MNLLFERIAPSTALAAAIFAIAPAYAQEDPVEDRPAPQAVQEEDVIVVRGQFIPNEKKATSEISSLLDAEDFARAGDSDIAAALRRVTGLSIQDGRFVIVRGLNERYSSATLNGLPLPSPEPLRRAAPLDLFPTSVIDSTLVQKTFSPQYAGEFGGGLVELRTKSIPDENFLTLGVDLALNTETTQESGLFHDGSDSDVFGFDDGLRDLPSEARQLFDNGSVDPATQNAIDVSFEQNDTLLIAREDAPANGGGSISFGRIFNENGTVNLGTVFYLGYDNDWETRIGERFRFEGVNSSSSDFELTRQEIAISALSSTGIAFNPEHTVTLTGLLVRKSLKQTGIETETFTGDDRVFLREKTGFIERALWQAQAVGEHEFPGLSDLGLDWKIAYGEASRDQPYRRETGFIQSAGTDEFLFTTEEGASNIDFRFLEDENFSAGLDFELPVTAFGEGEIVLKFGAAYADNSRITQRRAFEFDGTFPREILGSRADLIFSDPVLGLNQTTVEFRSTRGEPDNFEGDLEVMAAYAGAEFDIGPYISAAVGARYEDSTQETLTFRTRFPDDPSTFEPIEQDYLLPAVTVTWNPIGNFQIRSAYSETITRPQFRELSPSIFTDPDIDQSFIGNPFLVNSEIENLDIRAEWYFSRGEFATLGFFYKDIQNPIEEAIVSQGEAVRTTFLNAPSAELFGVEVEFEKNFDLLTFMPAIGFAEGKTLVFKTNYTYADGTVSDEGEVLVANISGQGITQSPRPAGANIRDGSQLVGLSEHLFNIQLGVEADNGVQFTLAGNFASERTVIRGEATSGGNFLPAVVEEPPVTVDAIVQLPFTVAGKQADLSLKAQNLLDEESNAFYENDGTSILGSEPAFQRYDVGRTFSIGLKVDF